eukprot:Gb_05451 [translate_table: standard]
MASETRGEAEQKLGLRPGTTSMQNDCGAPNVTDMGLEDGWEGLPRSRIPNKNDGPISSSAVLQGQGRSQATVSKSLVINTRLLPQGTGGPNLGAAEPLVQGQYGVSKPFNPTGHLN